MTPRTPIHAREAVISKLLTLLGEIDHLTPEDFKQLSSVIRIFALHNEKLAEMPYEMFLQTPYWKLVRSLKLMKQSIKYCEVCGSNKQLTIHHTTYAHRGSEHLHLDDLQVLCKKCHFNEHNKDDSFDYSEIYPEIELVFDRSLMP